MPLQAPDLLSELLEPLRLSGAFHSRWFARAPWSVAGDAESVALLHYVRRGACVVEMPGPGGPVHLQEGEVAVFPHGTAHRLGDQPGRLGVPIARLLPERAAGSVRDVHVGGNGEPTVLLCGGLAYDLLSVAPLYRALPPLLVLRRHVVESEPLIQAILHHLADDEVMARQAGRLVALRAFETAYLLALRVALAGDGDARRPLLALRHPGIAAVLGLVHSRFDRPWTLDALAQHAGMSRSAFAAAFRETVGVSPMRHLSDRRLQEAERLLAATDLPVAAVATRVGYASAAGLHLALSKHTGKTPGELRAARRSPATSPGEVAPVST